MSRLNWQEKQQQEFAEQEEIKAFYGETGIRKFKHPNPGPKPICACCGKPYGTPDETREAKRYAMGQPVEPYQGNGFVTQEWLVATTASGPDYRPGAQMTRYIWDGESYRARSGCDPFCTKRCAVQFAQGAYRAGWRMTKR